LSSASVSAPDADACEQEAATLALSG